MKQRKLTLHRHTLRTLDRAEIRRAAGGTLSTTLVEVTAGECPTEERTCKGTCFECPGFNTTDYVNPSWWW